MSLVHHPPRYEGGVQCRPPLNEAHQLKTSSPFQWVRHQPRSTQFVPRAFFSLSFSNRSPVETRLKRVIERAWHNTRGIIFSPKKREFSFILLNMFRGGKGIIISSILFAFEFQDRQVRDKYIGNSYRSEYLRNKSSFRTSCNNSSKER